MLCGNSSWLGERYRIWRYLSNLLRLVCEQLVDQGAVVRWSRGAHDCGGIGWVPPTGYVVFEPEVIAGVHSSRKDYNGA